jgi:transglutaminase-like putative cysteine protease
MPGLLTAVLFGWVFGGSRITSKQAWVGLIFFGFTGVFIFIGGLFRPLGRLIVFTISLIPQVILSMFGRARLDFSPLFAAWTELGNHISSVFVRLWAWLAALFTGNFLVDPLASGLVWNLILWFVGAWAAWHLRRNHQALRALAPGGILLAVVLDYSRGEVGFLVMYLACLLALMGLAGNEKRHRQWKLRKVDYSESIQIDTLVTVGMLTIALVLSASGAPSLSWRELVEKLREGDQINEDRVAQSLGLEAPTNVANSAPYRSNGLPRRHILDTPPGLLQDVVMTISTGELPPIPQAATDIQPYRYYWRAITYDVYSGVGWGSSPAQDVLLSANTSLLEFPDNYRLVTQHIKRRPGQPDSAHWSGVLAQVDTDIHIAWRVKPPSEPVPDYYGDMLGALVDVNEYTVHSYVPQNPTSELRASGSDYPPEISNRYLDLPKSTPERVLALSRQLTQASPTPYDRAIAIQTYLRTFPYTLDVGSPPPGRDIVDYFLFTAKKGYCDYYATSMVVLARGAGLPARMVIGYTSGDYNPSTAEYIVRQEDAHSWVEIYFSGIGWVEFEPTASQPAIDREEMPASESSPDLPVSLSALSWLQHQWKTLISSLGGQFIIAGMGIFLLIILWQWMEIGMLYLLSPQQALVLMYSRMKKSSMRLLPDLPTGHTPYQFKSAMFAGFQKVRFSLLRNLLSRAETDIEQIINLFVTQEFSQRTPTRKQVNSGIRAWIRVRWRLWITAIWNMD